MTKRFEFLSYLILFALFGVVIISESSQSEHFLYYTISLWFSTGLMLTISRFIVSPRFRKRQYYFSLIVLIVGIIVSYLTPANFLAKFQAEMANVDFKLALIIHPIVYKGVLPYIILATFIGFIHLIKVERKILRRVLLYSSIVTVLIASIFIIKYYSDITYEGDQSTYFIEKDHETLNAILSEDQFKNKVVYIDLWYSSCAPCIKEFKIKEEFKNDNVEFLYLARQTSHPNSIQLWKNAIKKHKLEGWHIYMTNEFRENTWDLIESNSTNIPRAYPHFLLVNKKGEIVSYNAKRPSDGQLLFDQIKTLLTK